MVECKRRGVQSQHVAGFVMLEFLLSLSLLVCGLSIALQNAEQVHRTWQAVRTRHEAFCLAHDTLEQVRSGARAMHPFSEHGFSITITTKSCCECAGYRYILVQVKGQGVEVSVCAGVRQ